MRSVRNCSVAVVGGAGFLGSHAVQHLVEDRGCDVLVIDNLVAGRREFIHPKAKFEYHDITGSEQRLYDLFKQYKIRFVGNWAAYPYIPVSFARPIHVADVNFMGAMKVINAAQEAGAEGILQVSSAEIYGEGPKRLLRDEPMTDVGEVPYYKEMRIDESGIVCPHSSYGVAKAAVDYAVQVRWREARTPCIALRQFNCVGERETHPYIVPEIISQLSKQIVYSSGGQPITPMLPDELKGHVHLGNNSFRDFMYAGDAVRIAVELLERGQFGEVYNLGSETGVKMYDLAKLIGKLMGFADVVVERDEARVRPYEIWHLQADNTKIRNTCVKMQGKETLEHLLMKPTPLEESLRRTIKWFEGNGRKWPWEK